MFSRDAVYNVHILTQLAILHLSSSLSVSAVR